MVEVVFKDKQEDTKSERVFSLDNPVEPPENPDSLDDIVVKEESEQPDEIKESAGEEIKEQVPEEEFRPSHKRKKRPHPGERIGQYAHKAKTYETAANMLFEQTKAQKEKIEALEREKQAFKEHALQLKADYAREVYEKAAEDGDVEKQAAAQNYMTQFNTELTLLKNKESKDDYHYQEPENLNEFLNYVPTPRTNVYAEEWLAENPWFDSTPGNPDFDPEMAQEAMQLSSIFDRELRRSRRSDVIGTPDYFDAISEAVRDKFGLTEDNEYEETYEEPSYQAPAPRQNIAPVSRSSGGNASRPATSHQRTVYLNSTEKELALSLDYGANLTAQEKLKRYADSKYKMEQENKNRRGR